MEVWIKSMKIQLKKVGTYIKIPYFWRIHDLKWGGALKWGEAGLEKSQGPTSVSALVLNDHFLLSINQIRLNPCKFFFFKDP